MTDEELATIKEQWREGKATYGHDDPLLWFRLANRVPTLIAEVERLRTESAELARAALAYDAAIQRNAAQEGSWTASDELGALYDTWITKARAMVEAH